MIDSRKKEDVKQMLSEYKNIELATRDRAAAYGSAIKEVNPNIKQIADKFHLEMNLTDKAKEDIKNNLPEEIIFNANYTITKNKKEAKYTLKRRKIIDLLYHDKLRLNQQEQVLVKKVFKYNKNIKILINEVKKFRNIMKHRDTKAFKKLIIKWQNSNISVLKTYTKGIYADYDAVINATQDKKTNALAEGKINKLKTIKRNLYGRGNSDLLKSRLLLSDYFHSIE